MKAWILSAGCMYEGGSIIAAFATEENGLKAAEKKMRDDIAHIEEICDENDPHKLFFVKTIEKEDHHYWVEHYCWKNTDGSWHDGDGDYLSLRCYELQ
jgi:hypothetical protein